LLVLVVTLPSTSVTDFITVALMLSPISNTAPAATVTGIILVSTVLLFVASLSSTLINFT
jgi:hypothetical protein